MNANRGHIDLEPYLTSLEHEQELLHKEFGDDAKGMHDSLTERVQGNIESKYGRLKPAAFPWKGVGMSVTVVVVALLLWQFWPTSSNDEVAAGPEPKPAKQDLAVVSDVENENGSSAEIVDTVATVIPTDVEEAEELSTQENPEESVPVEKPTPDAEFSPFAMGTNAGGNGTGGAGDFGDGGTSGGKGAGPENDGAKTKPENKLVLMSPVASCVVLSQDPKAEVDWSKMPEFPGGHSALDKHVTASIRGQRVVPDPQYDRAVMVEFFVNNSGKVYDWKVYGKPYPFVEAQIERMMTNFPKFEKGKVSGKKGKLRVEAHIKYN